MENLIWGQKLLLQLHSDWWNMEVVRTYQYADIESSQFMANCLWIICYLEAMCYLKSYKQRYTHWCSGGKKKTKTLNGLGFFLFFFAGSANARASQTFDDKWPSFYLKMGILSKKCSNWLIFHKVIEQNEVSSRQDGRSNRILSQGHLQPLPKNVTASADLYMNDMLCGLLQDSSDEVRHIVGLIGPFLPTQTNQRNKAAKVTFHMIIQSVPCFIHVLMHSAQFKCLLRYGFF